MRPTNPTVGCNPHVEVGARRSISLALHDILPDANAMAIPILRMRAAYRADPANEPQSLENRGPACAPPMAEIFHGFGPECQSHEKPV